MKIENNNRYNQTAQRGQRLGGRNNPAEPAAAASTNVDTFELSELDKNVADRARLELNLKIENNPLVGVRIALKNEIKRQGTGNIYKDLSNAYDKVYKEQGDGSDEFNSLLDEAFKGYLLKAVPTAKAMAQTLTDDDSLFAGFTESVNEFNRIFAETFLREYKNSGLEAAFKTAEERLLNETKTADDKIGYGDFMEIHQKLILSNRSGGHLQASVFVGLLNSKTLSESIKDLLGKRYEEYKRTNGYDLFTPERISNASNSVGYFREGSLGFALTKMLEGKVQNPSLIALDFEWKIIGTFNDRIGLSVEERAVSREIAIKNAEYIAENYFTDSAEAKEFLDIIKKFADNDILREKGYIVDDDGALPPFKSYAMTTSPAGVVDDNDLFARKFIGKNFADLTDDERKRFYAALAVNNQKWTNEIIAEWNANEKKAAAAIDAVKSAVANGDYDNEIQARLERLLRAF